MAPAIPIDYSGQRESKRFSNTGSEVMMGKTRKVSKGYSSGFVPDYRHGLETVAESEGFGSSGRFEAGLTALHDSFVPNRKSTSLDVDGYDRSLVPIQLIPLSKMSSLERRELEERLTSELEQVRKLQRKIASFTFDSNVRPPNSDVHSYQNGPKRPALVETLPMSSNHKPLPPGKKKIPPGRNGPRTKGGVMATARNKSVKQDLPQLTSSVMLMKQCETLLTRLMKHQHAPIFNEPVDIVKHKVPHYFNVIKHPMDLGTVKSKLVSDQYFSPMEFAADVRLTFRNAMTFNPPSHEVHVMADILSKFFEMRWKQIEKKIPATIDHQPTASKSSAIIEPESANVPPTKKQKTNSAENTVKLETDKCAMGAVEKQKLSEDLEALVAELPDNIINFLKENTSDGNQVSDDEIEIDVYALNDDTVFKLRTLVDNYLLEKQNKQLILEHREIEMQKDPGFSNLSAQPSKDNEPADIGGNDPQHVSCSPPVKVDEDVARRNSNCSSSRSSSSESGSSSTDTDSESFSDNELAGAKNSVPANSVNEAAERKGSEQVDPNTGDFLNGRAENDSVLNSSSNDPNFGQEGESAPLERQVSPEKQYRAALLRSRFADIIIKAQENTTEKGDKPDPEKLKLDREELERRRREEKARLQAEAKAAEEARKVAEVEAAAEARRKRELEREAARQALQKMEKTVEINENTHFMEDLELFGSAPNEDLQNLIEQAASPENSQSGLGSFKLRATSNPLEQLGLYMKNDEEEEEEVEPQSILDTSNDDPEEGEID